MPRSTASHERRKSSAVGHSRVIFSVTTERCSAGRARFEMISPTPKMPMASVATSMPSVKSRMPKVKRCPPVLPSVPTSPTSRPSTIMATALSTEPCASTTAATSPSSISEKYSGAPNDWPMRASGGAKPAISAVAIEPAKNDAIAATASAAPARPCRAIWWPSMQVTTEEVSPGRFTRIAVVEPPYCAP